MKELFEKNIGYSGIERIRIKKPENRGMINIISDVFI
jgi:hypothetical protein